MGRRPGTPGIPSRLVCRLGDTPQILRVEAAPRRRLSQEAAKTVETYIANSRQREFHASTQKYVLLLGAAGSGKSLALCWQAIVTALQYPGSLGVIARATYPALRDTTKRTFFDACPPGLLVREVRSAGREAVEFPNGSKILFRCFDSAPKLGSQEFDFVALDECVEVPEEIFRTLIARLRGRVGPRRMWLSTNPPDEDHYLHKFFVEDLAAKPALAADRVVIHSSTYDNAENLAPDYIRELESYPPDWREKFLHGRWGFLIVGRPVFTGFDPSLHMQALAVDSNRPLIRGWDFGRRHPACVWLQTTVDGRIHVLHELLGTDIELRDFAQQVVEHTRREFPGIAQIEDYCDVAGTQKNDRGPTSVQVLWNEFQISACYRKYGLHQSIERVAGFLRADRTGQPRLLVNVTCRWIRKAFSGGYYMDAKQDVPAKDGLYDNVMDALRYAVCGVTEPLGTTGAPYIGEPNPLQWRYLM